jgi:hypothetical protein
MNLQEVLERLHDRGATDAFIKNKRIQFTDGQRLNIFHRWKFKENLIELVDDRDPENPKYCYIGTEKIPI